MAPDIIVCAAALISYGAVLAGIPYRKRKYRQDTGRCLMPLEKRKEKLQYAALFLAVFVIILPLFRDMGTLMNIILSLCAVAGAEIIVRDSILHTMAGVYEHVLIVDGRYLPYDDIFAFPEFAYKNDRDEADENYARALKIVSNSHGVIFVGFADRKQKNDALALILELEPRLRP